MKRLLCTILIAAMLLSMFLLPACSNKTDPADTQVTTLPSGTAPSDPTKGTDAPTNAPDDPTEEPTDPMDPTDEPTDPIDPTEEPTDPVAPTEEPTSAPTEAPTQKPTDPPATEPPATEPPATEPPATEPPTEPPTEPQHIKITAPQGEVFPYVDNAKKYLTEGGDVGKYTFPATKNAAKGIEVKWEIDFTTKQFFIRYSTDETFATYKEVKVAGSKRTASLYNLLKGATYYIQVSAVDEAGKEHVAYSTFQTTNLGPRVLYVEGTYNVRDVGGYETSFGKTTLQGLIIRGDQLYPTITRNGINTMEEELGIKLEIDVRIPSQSEWTKSESIIPGAALKYCSLSGYSDCFSSSRDGYKQVFQQLAKPENYPVYIHCTGGADRTGTVCFLLNALLGVDEATLIQDYEFTTFSDWGTRSTKSGTYSSYWRPFYQTLTTQYEGDNLTENVESYLLSIGVKQAEIDNIRGIMFGEIEIPASAG